MLKKALRRMTEAIVYVLGNNAASIYLYGSAVVQDYRPGWSDLDILVLTEKTIEAEQAETLVQLRQALVNQYGDPIYRSFEGGMLSLDAFLHGQASRTVYWGTSGQRIADHYDLDSFSMMSLMEDGILLHGQDVRAAMRRPAVRELHAAVKRHYETIRQYGREPGRSLYSFGWLLDIARCLYTLNTGRIIAKTDAGSWALAQDLCPDPQALQAAIAARLNPSEASLSDAANLGPAIQRFADVLEEKLHSHGIDL